jgi:glutathionylspermidine synthase
LGNTVQRLSLPARPDWNAQLRGVGIDWGEGGYWQEEAYYAFTLAEIDRIEAAAQSLVEMLLETAGELILHGDLSSIGIPAFLHAAVRESWLRQDPALYMRLDLAYDGGTIKLLECNGQTPTSLIEASVAQWQWLEDRLQAGELPPGSDQWNSIHEALLARWGELSAGGLRSVHVAAGDSVEDWATVTYLQDLAQQSGLRTSTLTVAEIGRSHDRRFLIDLAGDDVPHLLWLWPFEFAWEEEFGPELALTQTRFTEPLWKAVLSSKGLLACLHDRWPEHPLLLPASLTPGTLGGNVARKPLYSREGQNVTLAGPTLSGTELDATGGQYGDLRLVEQQYVRLPEFRSAEGEARYPVLGVWVAGSTVCGLGVREAARRITDDRASFVPHVIVL